MANIHGNIDFIRLENNKPQTSPDVDVHGNSEDLDWSLKTKNFEDASECAIRFRTEKDTSHRRVMVVLCICLLTVLLALCILGILYSKQLGSHDVLIERYSNASLYHAQGQNATKLREEIDQLQVSLGEIRKSYQDLEAKHNTTEDHLSSCNKFSDKTVEKKTYYYLSTEKLNWVESQDFCVKTGGQLVKITSKEVQSYLASILQESYWIGLHDLYSEGHWIWVDNTTLSGDTFWYTRQNEPNEPDNWKGKDSAGEDCACLDKDHKNTWWFDSSCSNLKKFICEK